MEQDRSQPVTFLVGRLREALAEDPRTNSLDIQVTIAAGKVFLIGDVGTPEMRHAAECVVRELVPEGHVIVNELEVVPWRESGRSETLP